MILLTQAGPEEINSLAKLLANWTD